MTQCKSWLRNFALLILVLAALTAQALAADTPASFYQELERNLRAQNETFSIAYTADAQEDGLLFYGYAELAILLRQVSASSPDGPDSADIPSFNVRDGYAYFEDGTFEFEIEYMATQEQLDEVSSRVQEILSEMDLDGEDDYTKIKLIYEYICSNFIYDDTLSQFTAYEGLTTGTMVCQGYALLTYEMMWNADIPCRIIAGYSGESHAWNIVKLDGKWYNLDPTWDAVQKLGGAMTWDYFLKSPTDFRGHLRLDSYLGDYETTHPMAEKSMQLPRVKLLVNDGAVAGLIIRKGVEVQLKVELPADVDASEMQWVCENPELVELTEDGRLLVTSMGETLVSVKVDGKRGVISAQLPVQTVDLTTVSAWAEPLLTQYYLDQLLPGSLCSDFQQGLTRAELARMLNQFVLKTKGLESFYYYNMFEDIDDCPDSYAIANCVALGLMNGTSECFFRPDDLVTREQAAKTLVRLIEYLENIQSGGIGSLEDYADRDQISDWAAPFVATATRMGAMQGTDGNFRPAGEMTREQMVVALARIHGFWMDQQPAEEAA